MWVSTPHENRVQYREPRRSEWEQLTRAARRFHERVDVLLTHDWPSGIGTNREGKPVGDPSLRQLTETLRPRIRACGHMHHDHQAKIGPTQVLCLTKPANTHQDLQGIVAVERHRRGNSKYSSNHPNPQLIDIVNG